MDKSTHSGLDDEVNGALPTSNIVDRAMSAYGQAVGVTNFQMMKAFTSIANNGTMIQPRYISKVVDPQTGEERTTSNRSSDNLFQKKQQKKSCEYIEDVVESENYGSAYGVYRCTWIQCIGKTEQPKSLLIQGMLKQEIQPTLIFDCGDGSF